MQTKEQAFQKLSQSPFRSSFHLKAEDIEYIHKKGMQTIRCHAADFIKMRLAPAVIPNDGKQTPMKGHPIFIAQHACACCCRGCLEKWYHVPRGIVLTPELQSRIVGFLMAWVEREFDRYCNIK